MARKRFEELEKLYQAYKQANINLETANNIPKELKAYARWRNEDQGRKFDGSAGTGTPTTSSKRDKGGVIYVGLKPFGASFPTGVWAGIGITNRTNTWLNGNGSGFKTVLEYKTNYTANQIQIDVANYTPAKYIVRTGADANASEERRSRITLKPYRTRFRASDQGYVLPFGSANNKSYSTMVSNLNDVTLANSVRSIIPEKYRLKAAVTGTTP